MDGTSPSARPSDRRAAILATAAALVIGWLTAGTPYAAAQTAQRSVISREHKIKAAFVYNFGRYVQWPPEAFRDARAPFVIGVMGQSPVTAELHRIAETKGVRDRPIQVRQLSEEESEQKDLGGCHILFFPMAVESESRLKIVRRCSGSAILLVGENDDFLKLGGMIDLVIEQNRVRVYIALKAARREGLTISAKLLQVAHVVD